MATKSELLADANINDIDYHKVATIEHVYNINDSYSKPLKDDNSTIRDPQYWKYDNTQNMKYFTYRVRMDVEEMDPEILLNAYNIAPSKISIDTNARKTAPIYQQLKQANSLFWNNLNEDEFWEVLATLLNTTVEKSEEEQKWDHILGEN